MVLERCTQIEVNCICDIANHLKAVALADYSEISDGSSYTTWLETRNPEWPLLDCILGRLNSTEVSNDLEPVYQRLLDGNVDLHLEHLLALQEVLHRAGNEPA